MRFPFAPVEGELDPTSPPSAGVVAEAEAEIDLEECEAVAEILSGAEAEPADESSAEPSTVPQAFASDPAKDPRIALADPESKLTQYMPAEEAEPDSPSAELVLEADPEPLPPPVPRPPARRKVIAFPRPAMPPEELHHRLADPVVPEQPRILDVPEELEPFPTTPLLEGLQLPPAQNSALAPRDHIELPVQVASISRRISAGLLDFLLVVVGAALFGAVAYKLLHTPELTKPLLLTAAALPLLFWAAYQYMLTMYAGMTPGMMATRLRLSTFKGEAPKWRQRRSRVISLFFSAASLGMGLLWSLVDVDALCWHDRISHTYLVKRD
jgi:uncharacterized RDD family membrane protein YckC